jgi:hypothetical protein
MPGAEQGVSRGKAEERTNGWQGGAMGEWGPVTDVGLLLRYEGGAVSGISVSSMVVDREPWWTRGVGPGWSRGQGAAAGAGTNASDSVISSLMDFFGTEWFRIYLILNQTSSKWNGATLFYFTPELNTTLMKHMQITFLKKLVNG